MVYPLPALNGDALTAALIGINRFAGHHQHLAERLTFMHLESGDPVDHRQHIPGTNLAEVFGFGAAIELTAETVIDARLPVQRTARRIARLTGNEDRCPQVGRRCGQTAIACVGGRRFVVIDRVGVTDPPGEAANAGRSQFEGPGRRSANR